MLPRTKLSLYTLSTLEHITSICPQEHPWGSRSHATSPTLTATSGQKKRGGDGKGIAHMPSVYLEVMLSVIRAVMSKLDISVHDKEEVSCSLLS